MTAEVAAAPKLTAIVTCGECFARANASTSQAVSTPRYCHRNDRKTLVLSYEWPRLSLSALVARERDKERYSHPINNPSQ